MIYEICYKIKTTLSIIEDTEKKCSIKKLTVKLQNK